MLAAISFLLKADLSGVVNVTSPHPIRNEELMEGLRRYLNRPWSPPAPAALVRIGAFLMGSDPALALTGRRCVPARLLDAGFVFRFPDLSAALDDLLTRGR
jgi:NAD dependent epimerase/dehydratase family enzyme